MVQPAKKGRDSAELENRGNNKRKGGDADTRTAINKRQARYADQSSSPTTPRKRIRAGSVTESPSENVEDGLENTTTSVGGEADSTNITTIRYNAIEKRMELINQLTEQKENELKEIAFLEAGNNMMDYDSAFLKSKILTAKEEPGEGGPPTAGVQGGVEVVPSKKGPGRPAKDPNALSRKKQAQVAAAAALAAAQAQVLVQEVNPLTPTPTPTPTTPLPSSGTSILSPIPSSAPETPVQPPLPNQTPELPQGIA
jgi:hypothetical protein